MFNNIGNALNKLGGTMNLLAIEKLDGGTYNVDSILSAIKRKLFLSIADQLLIIAVHKKKSLELRHGTACGARYHKLDDAQYIQRDLLPIHFHTRCL